ncbi:MAG: hypothetical protein ABI690_21650 [Chloroflexota bacterium]
MSKRKNRSSAPNIPQATLDRARQQLGVSPESEPVEPVEAVEDVEAEVVAEAKPQAVKAAAVPSSRVAAQRASSASRSRTTNRRVQSAQSKGGRKEQLGTDIVKNRLLHPTRMVSEAELREEYGYVMADLRTIAIIAVAMVVLMVVLAQIL